MENLKELIHFVSKQKVAKIEVMGNPTNYKGKMRQLYNGIIEGKYKGDEDAISDLYGDNVNLNSYKKLKYRLQNRLINTVFFIDVNKPNYKDSQRAYYISQKSIAAIDILLGRGARKIAMELAEKTLRQVIKFEYTDLSINLLKKLTRHFGAIERNKKKYKEYLFLTQKYLEIFNAETIAEQFHTQIRFHAGRSSFVSNEILQEAIDSTEKLKQYLDKVDSDRFLMMAYLVFCNRYELENDYKNVLKICDEALDRFDEKETTRPISIFAFTTKKVDCLIQIKEYKRAESEIIKSLKLIPEGKINWLNTKERYMRMCLHIREYQKVYDVFMNISLNYGFEPAYNSTIETWKIYEAYLNFLIEIRKINPIENKGLKNKKFRISKFLNDVPTYSSDKRGYNIPILIIQLLFLLQQKNYDKVIDKAEALNAYCYRYLKKDDTFRSNCFIKMLLVLPKGNFNRIAVERKSKSLLEKLKSVPLEVARQSAEIEIVPYEDLWEIVLNMLGNKIYQHKSV